MMDNLLEQIQKTNPDITVEKLISEIRYSDYLTRALMISKGIASKEENCYTNK